MKLSDTSGTILLDVQWDQDDPNDKNRQNGAIRCDSGKSGRLENKKSGIIRIGEV